MKRFAILALALVSVSANAVVLYSNTVETGSRWNPGISAGLGTPNVAFDDVNVAAANNPSSLPLQITRVTVGLRRAADSPANGVNLFWAEGNLAAGTVNASNYIGSQALAARSGTGFITELVSISTNFIVNPDFTSNAGFGSFFIGISLDNNNASPSGVAQPTGWRLTNGPDANADFMIIRDGGPNGTQGTAWFGGPPNPSATFYIVVEGQPVPEPATMAVLGVGALALVRKRRK